MLCINSVYFLFFFFFQAEDGIRDYKVTGVQTCALPISRGGRQGSAARPAPGARGVSALEDRRRRGGAPRAQRRGAARFRADRAGDRKSTRLNSSHLVISYAVFCLKKKTHLRTIELSPRAPMMMV